MANSRRSVNISAGLLGLVLSISGCTHTSGTAAPAPVPAPTVKPAATVDDSKAPKITLKWSTASEVDNYGYFVYRSEDEKGPFTVLNERALPGAGNSEVPRDYRYEDRAVTMGKTYYYYLESVSTVGVKEKFSPVLKRECCKAPAPKEAPKDDKKEIAPASATPAVSPKKSR